MIDTACTYSKWPLVVRSRSLFAADGVLMFVDIHTARQYWEVSEHEAGNTKHILEIEHRLSRFCFQQNKVVCEEKGNCKKMHCGADHSWNRRWSYWLPSKTHIVDWNCRKYWKHKKNIYHFTKPILMIEIVKYIKKYQKEWWPPETHIENQNCQKEKKLLQ